MTRYRYRRGMTTQQKAGTAVVVGVVLAIASHTGAGKPHGGHTDAAAGMAIPAHYSSNEQLANKMAASGYGWTGHQRVCLDELWTRESAGTWSPTVVNPASGALGIPQALPPGKMASAGPNWQTSAPTQIRWGLGYVDGQYGSPCVAWQHELQSDWY